MTKVKNMQSPVSHMGNIVRIPPQNIMIRVFPRRINLGISACKIWDFYLKVLFR